MKVSPSRPELTQCSSSVWRKSATCWLAGFLHFRRFFALNIVVGVRQFLGGVGGSAMGEEHCESDLIGCEYRRGAREGLIPLSVW